MMQFYDLFIFNRAHAVIRYEIRDETHSPQEA